MNTIKQIEKFVECLNAIFELPVDWDFTSKESEIDIDILKEFSSLCHDLANYSGESEFHSAISFLWSMRNYVGVQSYNKSQFIGTEIDIEQCRQIMDILPYSKSEARNKFARSAATGVRLYSLLTSPDRDQIFETFLTRERLILTKFGLNQNSTSIIINRLRMYRFQIILNSGSQLSIDSNLIGKSYLALRSLAGVPVQAWANTAAGRRTRSNKRKRLVQAKDKVVGLATLFGDAAPLVFRQGLDVASFWSTVAGATTMAILPRGKPKA